ncbi:MAG: hypothetical protein RJA50_258, partial [Actinomycetota bacterium]
ASCAVLAARPRPRRRVKLDVLARSSVHTAVAAGR